MALNDIAVFPVLPGLAWSVVKAPIAQTRIQRAVSGRELRAQDYPYPLYRFQLTFNFLRNTPGFTELDTLLGFVSACSGAYGTFLFDDPSDDTSDTNQAIGTGDGATSVFQLYYSRPFITLPAFAVNQLSSVYLNGVLQSPSTYSCPVGLNSTGLLTFTSPVPSGWAITANFTFYYRCRFMQDSYEFENFMFQLWEQKKLDFISVFP